MVGRDQELALLLERWALAKAGEGQGVLLVGEAGIGKSRISRALLDALADEPHTRIRYQCSPYHTDSALWPVIQQLSRAAGFAAPTIRSTPGWTSWRRCSRGAGTLPRALIADLLGLDGSDRYGALDLTPQAQAGADAGGAGRAAARPGRAAAGPGGARGRPLDRPDHPRADRAGPGSDRQRPASLILLTSRPDRQPGLGRPSPRHPAHPQPAGPQRGRGDRRASRRRGRCPPRWSTRSSPAPTACRCSSRS